MAGRAVVGDTSSALEVAGPAGPRQSSTASSSFMQVGLCRERLGGRRAREL